MFYIIIHTKFQRVIFSDPGQINGWFEVGMGLRLDGMLVRKTDEIGDYLYHSM
jgi:hypothetical protein